jgi:predicted nucleotidyltransferase
MALLKFIKNNKEIRRIFGERELKIIEKQLLGISLSQSEKNRLSRDIRKKLKIIKEVYRFSEEFELKKGTEIKNIIKETLEIIKEDLLFRKIKKIYLFGSYFKNNVHFNSDIDIAVEFYDVNLKEATLFRKRITGKVNSKADMQVYNILPLNIKREIDKSRIIWKRE